MRALIDSFWRAVAYCLHPKVIALSAMPLAIAGGVTFAIGYFFWEPAVFSVRSVLDSWSLLDVLFHWLATIGAGSLRSVLAPLVIVAIALPVIVVVSLLLVAGFMTPAIVRLVVLRRFPQLDARGDSGVLRTVLASLGFAIVALFALVVTLPLWFIPPLAVLLPPAIWGWLAYRVLTFDTLVGHATSTERHAIRVSHRWPLLAMGVATGLLGAVPTLIWATSAFAFVLAPLLVLVSIWLYTLVFAFSSLWFAHYGLAALQLMRASSVEVRAHGVPVGVIIDTPPGAPLQPQSDDTPA